MIYLIGCGTLLLAITGFVAWLSLAGIDLDADWGDDED